MPNSITLEKLRQAIEAEQLTVKKTLAAYLELHAKMQAFQHGGPEPTSEEWAVWQQARRDIEALREKKLTSGVTQASTVRASH